MTKSHTTLTVDSELVDKAKKMGINMSKALNDYLKRLIIDQEEDLEGVNYELLSIDILKLQNSINQQQAMLTSKIKQKEQIQEQIEKNKTEELEADKKRIEDAKKCLNCGKLLDERQKSHKFTNGLVCNGCFLSGSAQDYKKWG